VGQGEAEGDADGDANGEPEASCAEDDGKTGTENSAQGDLDRWSFHFAPLQLMLGGAGLSP